MLDAWITVVGIRSFVGGVGVSEPTSSEPSRPEPSVASLPDAVTTRWAERLARLPTTHSKVSPFPKVCPVERLKGVGEVPRPLVADTLSDRRGQDHTSAMPTPHPSPQSHRSRPPNQL